MVRAVLNAVQVVACMEIPCREDEGGRSSNLCSTCQALHLGIPESRVKLCDMSADTEGLPGTMALPVMTHH